LRDQAAVAYEAGGLLSAGVSRFRSRRKKSRKEVRFAWNEMEACPFARREDLNRDHKEAFMGRGILLWLLGVPIPIIILIALLYH